MGEIEPLFPTRPRLSQRDVLALTEDNQVDHWIEHNIEIERRGRRTAWVVAIIMIVVCAAQAAAIAIMLPLKEVAPYTILVDRQTGYIETARGVKIGDMTEDQAIVESMLAQYVLARETFDPADFAERYDRVALWSLGSARDQYVAQYQAGAQSVLGDLRPGTTLKVIVKKIEVLSKDAARVRFETLRRDTGAEPVRLDWTAIVSFRFTGQPMRQEDRLLNPLGFQVTAYRRDSETAADRALIPAPQASAAPDAAPATGPAETSLAQPAPNKANTKEAHTRDGP